MESLTDIPTIDTLKDLLNEICWSYNYPSVDFMKDVCGNYHLNNLSITPDYVTYKKQTWVLEPGVFDHFVSFVELLNNKERAI